MQINLEQIMPWNALKGDMESVKRRLAENGELIIFCENCPQMVLLSLEEYQLLKGGKPDKDSEEKCGKLLETPQKPQGELKIGALVRTNLQRLMTEKKLTESDIADLKNPVYCYRVLRNTYQVLKPVDHSRPLKEQMNDDKGYGRYYRKTLTYNGCEYLLTNNWNEKPHRQAFLRWLGGR